MTIRSNRRLGGAVLALSGAALLVGAALAQPAAATDIPWGKAGFYTGKDLTGTVYPIAATDTECQTLPEPALSVANFAFAEVKVYFRENCETGSPSEPGDLYSNVTGLHWGNLPYPAVSYRVVPTYPPASPE
ncbi:hypothetical protein [Streptomyces sp. 6N106]|uniref:hypothetical protein n=1 Tax=Streptomyces sp. 6N106 TaxID=3457418 RepID=UPI003FD136B6